jgi:hypothetical protein
MKTIEIQLCLTNLNEEGQNKCNNERKCLESSVRHDYVL